MEPFAVTFGTAAYELFAESQRVGIRRYEGGGAVEVCQMLTPHVRSLLERGRELLGELIERYEQQGSADERAAGAEAGPIGAGEVAGSSHTSGLWELELLPAESALGTGPVQVPAAVPARQLGDVAYIAALELRQHLQRLAGHRPDSDVQEMISDCGSALRALKKSLYAVEPLLCQVERIEAFLPSSLETSLQVRRHYRKLWVFASQIGEVSPDTVRGALRGAGTRISILAGSEVYALLREDDRFYIQKLQARILDWLRDGTEPGTGTRIWQDFALFVEILRHVNLREELVQHDRELVGRALALLETNGAASLRECVTSLRPSLGLDDELDAALQLPAAADDLLSVLRRVAAALGAGEDSPPRTNWSKELDAERAVAIP